MKINFITNCNEFIFLCRKNRPVDDFSVQIFFDKKLHKHKHKKRIDVRKNLSTTNCE